MPDQSNTLSSSIQFHDSISNNEIKQKEEEIQQIKEDFNVKDSTGKPLLHRAIEKQDIPLIQKIINGGGDINIKNNTLKTALHIAMRIKNFEIITLLVENGAEVDCRDQENITPLFDAAFCEKEIFNYLIDNGANIQLKNDYQETPFDWLIQNNRFKEINLLNKPKINLKNAIIKNYPHESFDYISFDSINERDEMNRTILFHALSQPHFNIHLIEKLLKLGANIYQFGDNGNNLFHELATTIATEEAFNYLLNHTNLNVLSMNDLNQTPYMIYCRYFPANRNLPAFSILRKNPNEICTICDEENELFVLEDCGHYFCKDCLQHYFESEKVSSEFICPSKDCKLNINIRDIMKLTSLETFERINRLLTDKLCNTMNDFKWCPQCDDGGYFTEFEVKEAGENHAKKSFFCGFSQCNSCSVTYCNICSKKVVGTMEEHKLVCEDHFTYEIKSKIAKPCPRCKVYIEHNQGCSHMTCSSCRYQFCYICLGPYKPGVIIYQLDGPCGCNN